MRDEWKHDGFIENTLYRINFQAQNGFTLSTKGGARLEIRSGETTRGLYHVGSWLVETAGGQWDGMVELGLKGSLPACEKPLEALSVLIPGGTAALKFCLLKNSEVSRTYNAVRSFTIYKRFPMAPVQTFRQCCRKVTARRRHWGQGISPASAF